jgi:hypothetical protein
MSTYLGASHSDVVDPGDPAKPNHNGSAEALSFGQCPEGVRSSKATVGSELENTPQIQRFIWKIGIHFQVVLQNQSLSYWYRYRYFALSLGGGVGHLATT